MPVIPIGALTRARRRAAIDEYGRLQQKIDAHKPTKERHAELRAEIAAWYDASPADRPFLEDGADYTLQVGARTNERKIFSMPKLFKILGLETFLKLCSFPLAAVDASTETAQQKLFLDKTQTGPRELKVIARFPSPAGRKMAA